MSDPELRLRAVAVLAQANMVAAQRSQETLTVLATWRADYQDRLDLAMKTQASTGQLHHYIDGERAWLELAACALAQELHEAGDD